MSEYLAEYYEDGDDEDDSWWDDSCYNTGETGSSGATDDVEES